MTRKRYTTRHMASKKTVMFGAVAGMTVGGFAPMLWGDDNFFDLASVALTAVGGFLGIWLAYKVGQYYDL